MTAATAPAVDLAHYWVDPVTGFVPGTPPLRRLPSTFDAWETLLPEFPALLRAGRLRDALGALPLIPAEAAVSDAEQERALLLLCHFANAWVWGGPEPHLVLPRVIAVPLCALAATLERQPIAHYASMTLRNWQLVDPTRPLSADNARTQVQFLGGMDEDWFFISSMGVELAGAPLLPVVAMIDRASHEGDDAALAALVERFVEGLPAVHAALERVREWCDPHIFYRRVRPFVTGWPRPGVIYEGVWDDPRRYIGGSAAQSSLLQLFDAVLGVAHPDSPSGSYLRMVRDYMPRPHRAFVEAVEASSRLRERAAAGAPALRDAYNAALDHLTRFREAHMALARDYILRPAGPATDPTGTGGTALTSFLRGAQDTTAGARL